MSTTSRSNQKGEKIKPKYQSLDINSLYKTQDSEPTLQKGTQLRGTKNGMQLLGKVPTSRRPPINLPSLKSENSGNEPVVNLVPAGTGGWGSKPGEGPPPPTQPTVPVANVVNPAPAQPPVVVVNSVPSPPQQHEAALRGMIPPIDKSWSAIMGGEQSNNFLLHQSLQFQQEFPKLEAEGAIGQQGKVPEVQYGPGPSLRPQTEGSWTSGGARVQGGVGGAPAPQSLAQAPHIPMGQDPGAPRTNLGPHPAPGVVMGPAGPAFPHSGSYKPLNTYMLAGRTAPYPGNMPGMPPRMGMMPQGDHRFPPRQQGESSGEPVTRPLIRDEELTKMDEIALDPGWTLHQDIDYNQKLDFSDNEEDGNKNEKRDREKARGKDDKERGDRRSEERHMEKRSSVESDRRYAPVHPAQPTRVGDDERKKVRDVISTASERSRQRRDDETKRFDEAKKTAGGKRKDEGDTFLYPDFGDKERTRSGSESHDEKSRQGQRGGRNDLRDRDERDVKREVQENKYDRERDVKRDGEREPKQDKERRDDSKRDMPDRREFGGRSAPRTNAIAPRFRAKQAASAAANNFDSAWPRYPESEPVPETRETSDRYAKNRLDSRPYPPYNDRTDQRRFDYKKDRDDESDRAVEERDYKKNREPPARKDDRKEVSEEREVWRPMENHPPRPDSRDNRDPDFRGHSRESQSSRSDARDPPRAESRDVESRGHSQRLEGRDMESRGHAIRTDGKDYEHRSHPPRPDSRDDRSHSHRDEVRYSHRTDSRDGEVRSMGQRQESRDHQDMRGHVRELDRHSQRPDSRDGDKDRKDDRRPARPDSRDSRTSRDSRNSREDKHENDHKVGGRPGFANSHFKDGERKEHVNRQPPGPITRDKLEAAELTEMKPVAESDRQLDSSSVSGGQFQNGKSGVDIESASSCDGGSELGKGEKDERNRETKREGFAPSGQPSRRGRGAARTRGGGGPSRRIDGYGPPPAKPPFPHSDPLPAEEEEDRTKQKQAALTAGLSGPTIRTASNQQTASQSQRDRPAVARSQRVPSRDLDRNRSKPNRPGSKRGGKPGEGEEHWETLSNSEEDKKADSRGQHRNQGRDRDLTKSGPPRPRPPRSAPGGRPSDGKDDKIPEGGTKTKTIDGDSESANNFPDRKKNSRDSYRGDLPKSDSRPRPSGPSGSKEKRGGKGGTTTPTAPANPNGPQPLMSQVVSPPIMKNYNTGNSSWRQPTALPPRLQKQQQLQHQQLQQPSHQKINDAHDLPNIPESSPIFPAKESLSSGINAWEKSLGVVGANALDQGPSETSSQRSSPGGKLVTRGEQLLDDSAPPVTTIIFENTNLKAQTKFPSKPPAPSQHRHEKGIDRKTGDESADISAFGKPELSADTLTEQSMKSLYRDQNNINMDFPFNAELEMTEEKTNLTNKLAATKKLWELAGGEQGEEDSTGSAVFPVGFCQDPSIEAGAFSKTVDVVQDDCTMIHPADVVYSPVTGPYGTMAKPDSNTSSNVCKVVEQVKPQQQAVMVSGHSPLCHSGQTSISPPPFSSAQPNQYNYPQASLTASAAQFGTMPASPPAVMPFSSQLQASQNMFQTYQIDQGAGGQFSQFSTPYSMSAGGLGGSSSYNHSQLYLSHHAAAPPPSANDIYQSASINQFRLQQPPSAAFGQSQLNSNPNAVLLTSTSNSLMSASVKPSLQNIGAIGTKGPTFQQGSPSYLIPFEQLGINQSYVTGSRILPRGAPVATGGPNYYSNSPRPQTQFYGNPGPSMGQPGPTGQMHQPAGYSLQSYGTQSSALGLQNFSSQMGAQQYSNNLSAPTQYLKSGVTNNTQEVLASVFGAVPQIPSPKNRAPKQMNHPPPQQSPTQLQQNKFGPYSSGNPMVLQQAAGNHQRMPPTTMGLQPRGGGYPTPIQRPPHRNYRLPPQQGRPAGKSYYESQDGNMKLEDSGDVNKTDDTCQLNCENKPEPSAPPVSEVLDDRDKS